MRRAAQIGEYDDLIARLPGRIVRRSGRGSAELRRVDHAPRLRGRTLGQRHDLTFDLANTGSGSLCGSVPESCPDLSIQLNPSYCATAAHIQQARDQVVQPALTRLPALHDLAGHELCGDRGAGGRGVD